MTEPKKRKRSLNKAQKIAVKVYGGGDYSYIKKPEEADDVGDTLFTFIMRELGDDCGKLDMETAIDRMHSAIRDVDTVLCALEAAQ